MFKKLTDQESVVIGVTGQLATGKSTVAAMFAAYGARVINADLIAHRALRRHGACFKKVVRIFGKDILSRGEIDRQRLAAIVFVSPEKLKKLEEVIHPVVIRETRRQVSSLKKSGQKVIILDVPLLFESKMDKFVDMTITVKVNRQVQMMRCLRQRRLSRAQALMRIKLQLPMSEKVRRADIIVENGATIRRTEKQIKQIWEMILRRYINKI